MDFVGNSGSHKIISVVDILCGEKLDELDLEEYLRIAKASEQEIDVAELAEKVKQAREEREKQRELARLQHLMTSKFASSADYTAVSVDLFGGEEFGTETDNRPSTKKQAGFIHHWCGIPWHQAKRLTFKQANTVIKASRENAAKDWKSIFSMAKTPEALREAGFGLANRCKTDRLINEQHTLKQLREFYYERMQSIKNRQPVE